MQLIVKRTTQLNGTATLPSSKSECIRGIFFALLAEGESTLDNMLHSDDIEDAIQVGKLLGAKISREGDRLRVTGCPLPLQTNAQTIYSGNSGLTTRFALPLLGFREQAEQTIVLDCGEQMRARPIRPLITVVSRLGMNIEYLSKDGCCPIAVSGTLQGGQAEVDGLSSQYLSALLIALPCADRDSVITVNNLMSEPYAELTLNWLREQGIVHTHQRKDDTDIFHIQGRQRYQPFSKTITGDFSSASYFIAAAALTQGQILLHGLDMQHPQGDKKLVNILQNMGADISITSDQLLIRGGKPLHGLAIDANEIPDLLPTLAVIGTQASGETHIYNVRHAREKETDRIHSMAEGLSQMGAKVIATEDGLTLYPSELHGARVKGFGDHRTVMALTVAGMLAKKEETIISDAEAINKTFPTFVSLMQSLGGNISLSEQGNE